MAGAVGTENNDTAKRKSPEPVSNGGAPAVDEEAPDAKRRSIVRSCVHEVALPPGQRTQCAILLSFFGFSFFLRTRILQERANLVHARFGLACIGGFSFS